MSIAWVYLALAASSNKTPKVIENPLLFAAAEHLKPQKHLASERQRTVIE